MIVWSLIPQDSLAGGTPRRVTHRFTGGHGCRASGWEHQIERDMRQVHSSPGSDGLRLARRFTHDLEAETSWHPAPAASRADWPSLVVLSVPGGKVVAGDPDLKSSSDRHRVTTRQTSRPSNRTRQSRCALHRRGRRIFARASRRAVEHDARGRVRGNDPGEGQTPPGAALLPFARPGPSGRHLSHERDSPSPPVDVRRSEQEMTEITAR